MAVTLLNVVTATIKGGADDDSHSLLARYVAEDDDPSPTIFHARCAPRLNNSTWRSLAFRRRRRLRREKLDSTGAQFTLGGV
jgi:hypothetical protein